MSAQASCHLYYLLQSLQIRDLKLTVLGYVFSQLNQCNLDWLVLFSSESLVKAEGMCYLARNEY